MSTLRLLAGVMQRERTGLKVMQQMLVDRRDTLTVDDVIPVGDAFDYVVHGQDALDAQIAALFRSATALYRDKLRPLLLAKHGLTEPSLAADPAADPAGAPPAFRADDRLAKTLLLSAVAPKVPALKELTASRLASLNHGSIVSPVAGREVETVLAKVREWSSPVPEIHVGSDSRNPVIRVRLADVDYESVVERARGEDNEGRRRELLKELVREAFGVTDRDADVFGAVPHTVVWRGSRCETDLVFGNVRDAGWLSEDHFRHRPGTWRFVVDHPFDEPGHSSLEDLARLDALTAAGLRARTVVWLPRFLSEERLRELRRLVVLDWLLSGTGERWASHADHLSEVDRVTARAILESQRTALRERIRRAVQEAYGAAAPTPGTLADGIGDERVLVSLDDRFTPHRPVGADLGAAFTDLLDRAFSATYPGHPRFEPGDREVTVRELATVQALIDRAVAEPGGRVFMEPAERPGARRIATTLGVGHAGETHFVFGDDRFSFWGPEFERAAARARLGPHERVRVETVRGWITAVQPAWGLRPEVTDLVILAWAALRQRAWYHHGSPIPAPRPGGLRPEMETRPEPTPSAGEWKTAVERAQKVFGALGNPYLTPAAVASLTGTVRADAGRCADAAASLASAVTDAYRRLGLPADPAKGRLATARAAAALTDRLRRAGDGLAVVRIRPRCSTPYGPSWTTIGARRSR